MDESPGLVLTATCVMDAPRRRASSACRPTVRARDLVGPHGSRLGASPPPARSHLRGRHWHARARANRTQAPPVSGPAMCCPGHDPRTSGRAAGTLGGVRRPDPTTARASQPPPCACIRHRTDSASAPTLGRTTRRARLGAPRIRSLASSSPPRRCFVTRPVGMDPARVSAGQRRRDRPSARTPWSGPAVPGARPGAQSSGGGRRIPTRRPDAALGSGAGRTVDALTEQVGVTVVAGVLRDVTDEQPAH